MGLGNMKFDLFGVVVRPFEVNTGANGSKWGQGPFGQGFGPILGPLGPYRGPGPYCMSLGPGPLVGGPIAGLVLGSLWVCSELSQR